MVSGETNKKLWRDLTFKGNLMVSQDKHDDSDGERHFDAHGGGHKLDDASVNILGGQYSNWMFK